MREVFPNVYEEKGKKKSIYSKNAYPGKTHFGETERNGLRQWDPRRSKLGAAFAKGLAKPGLKQGDVVLYLGAGHGYTPSFVSDIVGRKGMVFCLDFSPRVVRDLVFVCEERSNMAPIMADANKSETYKHLLPKQVDVVFQDVAQKNQVEIFLKNCNAYLKKDGYAILALKARSQDVTKKPKDIFREVMKELQAKLKLVDRRELAPYEKDHALFVCKK